MPIFKEHSLEQTGFRPALSDTLPRQTARLLAWHAGGGVAGSMRAGPQAHTKCLMLGQAQCIWKRSCKWPQQLADVLCRATGSVLCDAWQK